MRALQVPAPRSVLPWLIAQVAACAWACGGASAGESATENSTSAGSTGASATESTSGGSTTGGAGDTGTSGETGGETSAGSGADGDDPWSPEWVDVHSVIVRPESLTRSFTGSGDYTERAEAFAEAAKGAGARGVFIELRAVDPSANNPEQAGHMMFPLEASEVLLASDVFVSHEGEDFGAEDGALLRALIDAVHRQGMQAYGWLPVFRDREVYLLGPPYITEPDSYEPDFVSVFEPAVRAHELEVIRQSMSRYCLAGLHLDYLRYQAEDQPQEAAADEMFEPLYGAPIGEAAAAGEGGALWGEFLELRAEGLRSFAAAARDEVALVRRAEIGAFLMPHSLRSTPEEGYSDEPWAGVDYGKLASVGLLLSPMVYWGHSDPGWTDDWMAFAQIVLKNLSVHVNAHAGSLALPTYSMAYATEELASALGYARERGIGGVTVFYYGDWLSPEGDQLARLDEAVALGLGPALYPEVLITSPAAGGVPVAWQAGDVLELEATLGVNPGEPEITDAWARLDGGTWRKVEVGAPGEPLSITGEDGFDLASEAAGCHTITVLVRDAKGRPGQDVLVVELG